MRFFSEYFICPFHFLWPKILRIIFTPKAIRCFRLFSNFYWFNFLFCVFYVLHYQFFIIIFPKLLVIWLVVKFFFFFNSLFSPFSSFTSASFSNFSFSSFSNFSFSSFSNFSSSYFSNFSFSCLSLSLFFSSCFFIFFLLNSSINASLSLTS